MIEGKAVVPVIVYLSLATAARAASIYVPDDYVAIRMAIAAAANGDTVIVRPGTYAERIDFASKAITIRSESGPAHTTIDGGGGGSTVRFDQGEGRDSRLIGFTITGGQDFTGGGIYCHETSPVIEGNDIRGNRSSWDGGGIAVFSHEYSSLASPAIRNNLIEANIAGWGGGGISLDHSAAEIVGNIIRENSAGNQGGGIGCRYEDEPLIANNIITGNSTELDGGGIFCGWKSLPVIAGNTVYGNDASLGGGGLACDFGGSPSVTNTVLWSNTASFGDEIGLLHYLYSATATIDYSDVEGGFESAFVDDECELVWGEGMLDLDPVFAEPETGDFHLTLTSPCRGGGDSRALDFPFEDFEHDPRGADGAVDIGADEFHPHLYYMGITNPGASLSVRVVSGRIGAPVVLGVAEELLHPPMSTPWGELSLSPPFALLPLGTIGDRGVLFAERELPRFWAFGERKGAQALVGLPGSRKASFTNLVMVDVIVDP